MIEAKYGEILYQINRGKFRALLTAEPSNGEDMITLQYVLTIKTRRDKKGGYKERYDAEVHTDIMKDYLIHAFQTVQYLSMRIISIFF